MFKQYMNSRGIAVSEVHARNDKHTGFMYPNGELLGVDVFNSDQISIPVGWWITDDDRKYITDTINAYRPYSV